jgi:hypothetical protein
MGGITVNNTSTQNKILRHKTTGLYFNGYGYHEPKAENAMRSYSDWVRLSGEFIDEQNAEAVPCARSVFSMEAAS